MGVAAGGLVHADDGPWGDFHAQILAGDEEKIVAGGDLHAAVLQEHRAGQSLEEGGLPATAEPGMASGRLPAVEDGLVLPVIIGPAEHMDVLAPDKARRQLEAGACEGLAEAQSLGFRVGHIDGRAVGQRREDPVQKRAKRRGRHVIVEDRSDLAFDGHIVRRIRHGQFRALAFEQPFQIGRRGGVAAQQPVPSQIPNVARPGDGRFGDVRHVVGIRASNTRQQVEQFVQLGHVKAGQGQIHVQLAQLAQFHGHHLVIPGRPGGRAVDQQPEGPHLRRGQVVSQDHGYGRHAQVRGRVQAQAAVDHLAVGAGQHRHPEPVFPD